MARGYGDVGILGGYQQAPSYGGIFAALKDAGSYFSGRGDTDNFAQYSQLAQAQQVRQQLLQGLTSSDPATRQQAYAFAAINGIDTKPFQQMQASQALPQLLAKMQPQAETAQVSAPAVSAQLPNLPPSMGTLNLPQVSGTYDTGNTKPGMGLSEALSATNNPELQGLYAPQIISDTLERQAKAVRPATAQEKIAAGLDPKTPAQVNAYGQLSPISDPNQITAYQRESLARQQASDAENRRHNLALEASGREGGGGLFSMIDTGQGVYGVTRGAKLVPMLDPATNKPLVSYHSDTGLRFGLNAAGVGGKNAGTAAESWPTTEANFQNVAAVVNGFYDPKVRAQAGKSLGYASVLPTIPGVNSDFRSRQAALKGTAFLDAYGALRGGGAITEIEGSKAEAARLRAINANTESEFYSALNDFSQAVGRSHAAARMRAQRGAVLPQMNVQEGTHPMGPNANKPSVSNW